MAGLSFFPNSAVLQLMNTKKAAAFNLSDVAPFARPDRRQAHHDKELKASQPDSRILSGAGLVNPGVYSSKLKQWLAD